MKNDSNVTRRNFIATTGTALAGVMIADPFGSIQSNAGMAGPKKRVAIVGTGGRALGMWCKDVIANYSDKVEYVGLCDINPGQG